MRGSRSTRKLIDKYLIAGLLSNILKTDTSTQQPVLDIDCFKRHIEVLKPATIEYVILADLLYHRDLIIKPVSSAEDFNARLAVIERFLTAYEHLDRSTLYSGFFVFVYNECITKLVRRNYRSLKKWERPDLVLAPDSRQKFDSVVKKLYDAKIGRTANAAVNTVRRGWLGKLLHQTKQATIREQDKVTRLASMICGIIGSNDDSSTCAKKLAKDDLQVGEKIMGVMRMALDKMPNWFDELKTEEPKRESTLRRRASLAARDTFAFVMGYS